MFLPECGCMLCPGLSQKLFVGNAPCLVCPEFMSYPESVDFNQTDTAVNIIEFCQCEPGYTGPNGGPCAPCADGLHKPNYGPQACQQCPTGLYPSLNKSFCSGSQCLSCPSGTSKDYPGNNTCDACEKGSYSETTGQTSCLSCRFGKYQDTTGQSACTSTNAKIGSITRKDCLFILTSISQCLCNRGYEKVGDECVSCPAGTYKSAYTDTPCQCLQCALYATSAVGSLYKPACECIPGYRATTGKNCLACAMGTYKSVTGNYACELCPDNTWSDMASTSINDCLCLPSYTFYNGACIQCDYGKYKSTIGQEACSNCPSNSISLLGSKNISDCYCLASYTLVNGNCQLCPANTYKSSNGNQACTSCPLNSFSPIGSNSVINCICLENYIKLPNGECQLCPAGSYKYDYYTCRLCPSKEGAQNISACICNSGYYGYNGERCLPCPVGTYMLEQSSVTSLQQCISCPADSSSALASKSFDSCKCNQGFYIKDSTTCDVVLQSEQTQYNYTTLSFEDITSSPNILSDSSLITVTMIVDAVQITSGTPLMFDNDFITGKIKSQSTVQLYDGQDRIWSQYLDFSSSKYTMQPFLYLTHIRFMFMGTFSVYEIQAFEGCGDNCILGGTKYVVADNGPLYSNNVDQALMDSDPFTSVTLDGSLAINFNNVQRFYRIDIYFEILETDTLLLRLYNSTDFTSRQEYDIFTLEIPFENYYTEYKIFTLSTYTFVDIIEIVTMNPTNNLDIRTFQDDCTSDCKRIIYEPYQENVLTMAELRTMR
eukprot:538163-Hanusia_phi.AAC.1